MKKKIPSDTNFCYCSECHICEETPRGIIIIVAIIIIIMIIIMIIIIIIIIILLLLLLSLLLLLLSFIIIIIALYLNLFGCLHLGQWPMTYFMTLSDWTMSCQPWPPRARYGQ